MTLQLSSALFAGSADKYLPMSAINVMRVVMSFGNVHGAFVMNGLQHYDTTSSKYLDNSIANVNLVHPTFYMNMVHHNLGLVERISRDATPIPRWLGDFCPLLLLLELLQPRTAE